MWTLSGFADEIDADPEVQCSTLDALGVRWLEFRSAWGTNVLDLTDEQLDQFATTLEAHDIRVSSIGSPIGKIGIDDDFGEHLARMDRCLEVAARFGAPYIRLFSFYCGADPDSRRDDVVARMTALAERASGRGVVLLHENEKEIFGDVPRRCADLVTAVDSPVLRLAWDAANYVQCGVRPFDEAFAATRPFTDYIQVKDALLATGEVVPAGEGDGQWPQVIQALAEDGFDGFFSMEPHLTLGHMLGGFSGVDAFTRATRAFQNLLSQHGIEFA